jgi:galactose mutarotase-like enzyme
LPRSLLCCTTIIIKEGFTMIIQIGDETGSAQIDSMGAQLISLKNACGTEYLWQGDPLYWSGQAPILFPMVGALRGGKTMINDKEYEMKRHGFARRMEFSKSNTTASSVDFSLGANGETKKQYPFDFELTVTYSFHAGALTTAFCVANLGKEPMPFVVGGHPAFRCPLSHDEQFEDWSIEFEHNETADCPQIDLQSGMVYFDKRTPLLKNEKTILLRHSLFKQDALMFDSLQSKKVKLFSRKSGHGIEMTFNGFDYLGIWSAVNDAPFVAIEPWTGCATAEDEDDTFCHKRGMTLLQPGQSTARAFTSAII